MSKMEKIPELLDNLLTCSMAEAARRCGISPSLPWKWLVQSRLGHPELQAIEFCGVTAPYHVQLDNAKLLAVQAIEQNAVERARDGMLVPVFFQGQRQYERVLKEEFAGKDEETLAFEIGPDWERECYETKQTMQLLKPSDALVIKVLESWKRKRYGAHQTIDVNYGGVLRLDKDAKPKPEAIEATAVELFDGEAEDGPEQRGGHLALAAPAASSEEFDARAAAGEFRPAPVVFKNASGETTALRPDIEQLRRQAEELRHNGPAHPYPVNAAGHRMHPLTNVGQGRDDPPDDGDRGLRPSPYAPYNPPPSPAPRAPVLPAHERSGGVVEGVGEGPDPKFLGGHRGFKVV